MCHSEGKSEVDPVFFNRTPNHEREVEL